MWDNIAILLSNVFLLAWCEVEGGLRLACEFIFLFLDTASPWTLVSFDGGTKLFLERVWLEALYLTPNVEWLA